MRNSVLFSEMPWLIFVGMPMIGVGGAVYAITGLENVSIHICFIHYLLWLFIQQGLLKDMTCNTHTREWNWHLLAQCLNYKIISSKKYCTLLFEKKMLVWWYFQVTFILYHIFSKAPFLQWVKLTYFFRWGLSKTL